MEQLNIRAKSEPDTGLHFRFVELSHILNN